MNEWRGIWKLTRPLTSLTGALTVLLGGYVAATGNWANILLAGLVTILASGAANAWNDYLDIEIDRVNQPGRPLPAGLVAPKTAIRFSVITSAIALALSFFINLPSFILAVVCCFVLYYYSWKLKSTVLSGNITIASIASLSVIFGGLAAGNVRPTWLPALIVFVTILGREVLKTLADYEGDLVGRCRTVATVWGRRRARVLFLILISLVCFVMLLPYLLNTYAPVYAYTIAIGVYPLIFYVILKVNEHTTGAQLERLSQLMKYDFLVWFLAVVMGAALA